MMDQRLLSWPNPKKCKKINEKIYESNINPFSISRYVKGKKIIDFVGRTDELTIIHRYINDVFNNKVSVAIRLEGPAGVGKSTLFNYLKESIEHERATRNPQTNYIMKNFDILSTYFTVPDRIVEFRDIWKEMMKGLTPGFDEETGADLSLPEYIAFRLIYRMFKLNPDDLLPIIWSNTPYPENYHHVELRDIIEPFLDGESKSVRDIIDYYNKNKRSLRKDLRTTINAVSYEIKKTDTSKIIELFKSLDEDDEDNYLEMINDATLPYITGDEALIEYFNDLMRFYACSTEKQPLILIGIDEFVKITSDASEEYYTTLGNLFVKLRNSLKYILFVLISTTEDWVQFDKFILKKSDLNNQINSFVNKISLSQLSVDEMINVFKNRMQRFWENYPQNQPINAPDYPFSNNFFRYIYRYNQRNLRNSIIFLQDLWNSFAHKKQIPKMEQKFESMRAVLNYYGTTIDPSKFKPYDWEIIREEFEKPERFSSQGGPSNLVEKGLENAWRCLTFDDVPTVTLVRNNPIVRINGVIHRPDVAVYLLDNLGAEYRRKIEFQVKIYKENSNIDYNHIESSIKLFEANWTDYLYFVIIGGGLSSTAEEYVSKLELAYPSRILRPILTQNQKNRLYFLALFEEITGRPMNGQFDNDRSIAEMMLQSILNQQIISFLNKIKALPYRELKLDSIEEQEHQNIVGTSVASESIILDQFVDVPKTLTDIHDSTTSNAVAWIDNFPNLKTERNELCGLCQYLKSREKGRYQWKFTKTTVQKNVISLNALYSKDNFGNLVQKLQDLDYVLKEKSSFVLTEKGIDLYKEVKRNHYQC